MENYQIEQKINVYLDAGGIPPEVYIKQYDHNLRVIAAQVWDGAQPYALPAGYVARVGVRKSDGKRVLNDCETSADGPTLTVYAVITQQMTAVAGKQRAEIQISGPEGQLRSGSFVLDVVPAEVGEDVIESTDEYKSIDAILAEVRQLKAAADKDAQAAVQSAAAAKASETAAANSQSAAAGSATAAAGSAAAAKNSETAAAASKTAAASSATAAKTSETAAAASATAAAKSAEDAKIAAGGGVLKFNGRVGEVVPQTGDYTAAQVGAVATSGGELAKTKVTYTTPKSGAPASGETMEVIMAKVTAMYNRMVEIEAALPPIGDWVLAEDRIVYDSGGVNGRTYPWVNFDDNLDPAVYPKLYAKIGTKWSSGAPSGYFNLALLKDRFPLVSSSNFAATGGEEKHTLTTAELPKTEITLANSYGSLATTDADFSTAAASQKLVIGNPNNAWATHPFSRSFGDSKAHNNVPPYVATCAHVRAG